MFRVFDADSRAPYSFKVDHSLALILVTLLHGLHTSKLCRDISGRLARSLNPFSTRVHILKPIMLLGDYLDLPWPIKWLPRCINSADKPRDWKVRQITEPYPNYLCKSLQFRTPHQPCRSWQTTYFYPYRSTMNSIRPRTPMAIIMI